MDRPWLEQLAATLPRHAALIGRLCDGVCLDERWRWLVVGCSLGAGRGDEWSDIDCGIGYAEPIDPDELDRRGRELVAAGGDVVDLLVHVMEGWQPETPRFAAEYTDGVQLDLVLLPSARRRAIFDDEIAVVDKDGSLAEHKQHPASGPPDQLLAREWVSMGWWWVSDVAKYLRRGTLFEAAERIALVRANALRLHATANGVPFPQFGLTSLLDFPPFEVPDGLAATYPDPGDRASVAGAGVAVADLLAVAADRAAATLGYDLATPWEATARARLNRAAEMAKNAISRPSLGRGGTL